MRQGQKVDGIYRTGILPRAKGTKSGRSFYPAGQALRWTRCTSTGIGLSLPSIASALNERKTATPTGGKWHAATVIRVQKRIAEGRSDDAAQFSSVANMSFCLLSMSSLSLHRYLLLQ
jgi:hypothetical protein